MQLRLRFLARLLLGVLSRRLSAYFGGRDPHAITKMAAGCALTAVAQGIMVVAAMGVSVRAGAQGRLEYASKAPLGLLVLAIAVTTVGELLLSPVGLNFATQVAPKELCSFFVGIWMTSSFFGNFIAGMLGAT